jgi:hypothetical protein
MASWIACAISGFFRFSSPICPAVFSLYPETKHEAFKGNRHTKLDVAENATSKPERFTKATANALGRSERTVQLNGVRGANHLVFPSSSGIADEYDRLRT